MPNLIVGSVPRGEDYFDREDLIENLWTRLQTDSVLLVAPRRFGKTGAMYRLLDEPREPYRPLYVDVEPILSPADFVVELLALLLRDHHFSRISAALWKGTKGLGRFLRDLPAGVNIGELKIEIRERTDVPTHWRSYGDRIMSLLAKESPALLLLLDEFAVMVWNIAQRDRREVEQFLRWFRAARTSPETRTRFVIGGSINLVSTLDALGLVDTINDLSIIRMKPFSPGTAGRFVEAVFTTREVELPPEVKETILKLVGEPIPYFLAVFLTAVLERQRATHDPLDSDLVEAAFEEDLMEGSVSVVLQHYRSRIGQYYPDAEGRAARAILGLLSRSDAPVSRDALYQLFLKAGNTPAGQESEEAFSRLMNRLDNDFYVVAKDGKYGFFSRLFQLWWRSRYGFQVE